MRCRAVFVVAMALVAVPLVAAGATADDTKWVRGKVTAVGNDSVAVNVRDKEMKFTVDKDTEVVAPGAGTMTREARSQGLPGPKITEIVKVGDGVEVHYHDMGSMLHATEIRAGISVGSGTASEDSGKSASGIVSAVAGGSLTIKSGSREWKFTVDSNTTVVGRGAGTLTREKKAAGAATVLTDFVSVGDRVVVTYHEMGTMLHAAEVRVARKATSSHD